LGLTGGRDDFVLRVTRGEGKKKDYKKTRNNGSHEINCN
jgi:hypothetical protein